MIKTINLNGFEAKVTEIGGDNTEIFNNSGDIIYASKLPNITIGGDDVIAIPAGAIDGLYGTRGTIYLLGTGSVELRGVDHKVTKTRGQSTTIPSGGVSKSYVEEKCNETLENANAYADVKKSEIVVSLKEYADEKDTETLDLTKAYTDSLNAELAGYIGHTDSDIYGLEADFENNVFIRLAGAVGKSAGADFDCVNAYGGRRRCNLSDDGEVLAYYGDENFKADGSNGQVMVEQPKFYYRVVALKTEKIDGADGYHLRKARYYISDTPKAGFKVHPAFIRNGAEVDRIYLSAFEGCIYDTSANAYLLNDEQIADFNNDKLSSISGAKPCSGQTQQLTRANARNLAHNRGNGWEQSYMATVSATELLMIIEFASFNMQTAIGIANTDKSSSSANIKNTGLTLNCGNITGIRTNNDNIQFVTYRGEENFYGNIWTWVDGGNMFYDTATNNYGEFYVTDHDFTDDTNLSPYIDTGIKSCCAKGYVSAFGYSEKFDWLFISSECKGNSGLPIGDYFWSANRGWVTAIFGGCCYDKQNAGAFYWSIYNMSSLHTWTAGARLVYVPNINIAEVSEKN